MAQIEITKEAHNMIRAKTRPDHIFKDTSRPLPNGNLLIELEPDTIARIDAFKLEGESRSDCIIRSLSTRQ